MQLYVQVKEHIKAQDVKNLLDVNSCWDITVHDQILVIEMSNELDGEQETSEVLLELGNNLQVVGLVKSFNL